MSIRAQTMIAVTDVERSSRWYQTLLGCVSQHGGAEYDRLAEPDALPSDFFMQLHCWEDHGHPNIQDPESAPHGFGVLLWFHMEDFDAAAERAADVVQPRHENPLARHEELWIRDLDGYVVVLSGNENPHG